MKHLHSNVSIRSNIFVRVSSDLANDKEFLWQVRGREAILKLLHRIASSQDTRQVARKYLSKNQLAQVAWQAPCALCGALPEGPVMGKSGLEIQFRCPRGTCPVGNLMRRTILLEIDLIRRLTNRFGKTVPEILPTALQQIDPLIDTMRSPEPARVNFTRRRVVVFLTRSQYYLLTDTDIESALNDFLETRDVVG
jgi:hypothetical protein